MVRGEGRTISLSAPGALLQGTCCQQTVTICQLDTTILQLNNRASASSAHARVADQSRSDGPEARKGHGQEYAGDAHNVAGRRLARVVPVRVRAHHAWHVTHWHLRRQLLQLQLLEPHELGPTRLHRQLAHDLVRLALRQDLERV